jgi:hypothetical protein
MWIRISGSARFERCVACDSNRPLLALRSRGARSFDVASSASATVWSTLEADFALALSPTHLLSCAGRRIGGLADFLARQRALSAVATAPTSAATRDDESVVDCGVDLGVDLLAARHRRRRQVRDSSRRLSSSPLRGALGKVRLVSGCRCGEERALAARANS